MMPEMGMDNSMNGSAGKNGTPYFVSVVSSLINEFKLNLHGSYSAGEFSSDPKELTSQMRTVGDYAAILYGSLRAFASDVERRDTQEDEKMHDVRSMFKGMIKLLLEGEELSKTMLITTVAFAAQFAIDGKKNYEEKYVDIGIDELISFTFEKVDKRAAGYLLGKFRRECPSLPLITSEHLVQRKNWEDQMDRLIRE
jgi:hypothetical protein